MTGLQADPDPTRNVLLPHATEADMPPGDTPASAAQGGTEQYVRPGRPPLLIAAVVVLYACATLQFVRFYTVSATFYLNLPAYLAGQERLPFQYRVLPALLTRALYATHLLQAAGMHQNGAFTTERAPLYLISLVSLILAGIFTQVTYRALSRSRRFNLLVYPVFLFTMIWTYSIHVEANFSYPYDFLSVAFFAAGLLCIVTRRFLPLLAVIALGTLNRETTLFLIGIYLLDAASTGLTGPRVSWKSRFSLQQVPWPRAVLLLAVWIAIRAALAHHYAGNDRTEDYVRLRRTSAGSRPASGPRSSIPAAICCLSFFCSRWISGRCAFATTYAFCLSGSPSCSTPASSWKPASTESCAPMSRSRSFLSWRTNLAKIPE
ncbi:MAG TPA: hypothetical protein VKV02_03120 [Acidobacteriaceae bacterium]|nr:hypothetical protein [Acidobacteriaceae bacterium]